MEQIFIENYQIDIKRCLVHRESDTFSLEPKVVQVLLFLAEHQGEVVSYQALLDAIWPNSIVAPSALQRCIGQLRKAFQDDAKQQRVIKTYSKNGYSLIAEVRRETLQNKNKSLPKALPTLVILSVLTLILLTWQTFQAKPPAPSYDAFSIIESSQPEDASSDFYAAYSPNGRYIVYPRFIDGHLRHLWARDLSNDTEYQLTPQPGIYQDMAWSTDSKKIVFIEANCLDKSCQHVQCSTLELITLPLNNNIHLQNLISCQSNQLQSPQWLNQDRIALIEKSPQHTAVIRYELSTANTAILFQQSDKTPHHLSYSPKAETLVITTSNINSRHQQKIFLLSSTGKLKPIDLPTLPNELLNSLWHPTWNHQADGLLILGDSGLFNITLDGNIVEQGALLLPSGD